MSRLFSEYTQQFFWDFKRRDNINYNFEIVQLLYVAKQNAGDNTKLNKPIIILLVAIIECMLYDFIIRINFHKTDSFPNITNVIIAYFRNIKTRDELRYIIPHLQTHNLLRVPVGDSTYIDLEHLRHVRNRVHIQNRNDVLNRDEYNVFTNSELQKAEKCFERVCEILCNVYPRWGNSPIPMTDFPRPW